MKKLLGIIKRLLLLFKKKNVKEQDPILYKTKEEIKEKEYKEPAKEYDPKKGHLVWNSKIYGTYIRTIHGAL